MMLESRREKMKLKRQKALTSRPLFMESLSCIFKSVEMKSRE
ncbi:hypothetical protein HMPREF1869_01336 [Bacteroidales bacterium KA00251]|nr:hypothetical protein HMPREF1869_01336 [Bacteroidales bacterium KA00251]